MLLLSYSLDHADELADLIVLENGKTKPEALAEVAKGNETVDWSTGLPHQLIGGFLQVSRDLRCSNIIDCETILILPQ